MRRPVAVVAGFCLSFAFAQTALRAQAPSGANAASETRIAEDYLRRGRQEDAIRQAKIALGRDERYVPAMVVLAKAYYAQRKFELATSIIDIAKSVDANNAECYNLLGFLALKRDDHISATAAFKKATELNGSYTAAWNNLASQYLYAKNYDSALEAAENATRLAPGFASAQLNLGSALRGKQRYVDADGAYRRALAADPSMTDAYFNLGILYLDAKEIPNQDLITKLNAAIAFFTRYKQAVGARITKDDPVDTYIAEARAGIDREQKRQERLKRQQDRNKPKADAPAASDGSKPNDQEKPK